VQRLQDKPFVLLGVNSDEDRDEARKQAQEQTLTWRSFWNGGDRDGPITRLWNVSMWPSFYLLDHKGVIRLRPDAFVGPEQLDQAVDALLRELEAEKK
jgi:hypothetical protein